CALTDLAYVTQMEISFVMYSTHDFRELHPFPTRRSSDLASFGPAGGVHGVSAVLPVTGVGMLWSSTCICSRIGPTGAGALANAGDRKSTRLNSSHVATSYAVFGLKKKSQMCLRKRTPISL